MIQNITGVILAGGASSRFNGIVKSKIIIEGKPIISRIIGIIGDIFEEIIIVTNTPGEFEEYDRFKIIRDRILNKGPLGGIHAALKESGSDALFVFAGDMPLLEKEIILRQIAHFNINSCDVLIPRVNNFNEPLHAIYRKSILPMLEEYLAKNNTYALTEFCRKASTLCMQLDDSEQSRRAFTNINSPSDLEHIKKF
jgi:molybdopterin-guanine dinucleotide biosynthesis protein A